VTRALHLDKQFTEPSLKTLLNRRGEEVMVDIATVPTEHMEPERCLYTAGVSICDVPLSIRQEAGQLFSGVWITHYARGTPAERFGFLSSEFLLCVNDNPTPTFEDFCYEINRIGDGVFFRVDCMSKEKVPRVCTVRKDELFIPSKVTFKDPKASVGWSTIPLADYVEQVLKGERKTPLTEKSLPIREPNGSPAASGSSESIEIIEGAEESGPDAEQHEGETN
jgi:hypothetical protein